jgi:hypothetical protein
MLTGGMLFDLEEEVKTANTDRCREIGLELISEIHRLRELINEMCDFRSSNEHERMMGEFEKLRKSISQEDDVK